MFNFAKRVRERQLKRALLIKDFVMLRIFSHQRKALGLESGKSSELDRVVASAVNQLFARDAGIDDFSQDERRLCLEIMDAVKSEPLSEKVILRVLFDIFTLGMTLKRPEILAEYPTIIDVLERGKRLHPDVFQDWRELQFQTLLGHFADKYDPASKGSLLKLFS
jgi:hypothetical protein